MKNVDTIDVRDSVSGKMFQLKRPLRPEHVKVGQFLWYHMDLTVGEYSGPAVIVSVSKLRRKFKIRPLYKYGEDEEYKIKLDIYDSPRNTMQLMTEEEVKKYIERRMKWLDEKMDSLEREVNELEEELLNLREKKMSGKYY